MDRSECFSRYDDECCELWALVSLLLSLLWRQEYFILWVIPVQPRHIPHSTTLIVAATNEEKKTPENEMRKLSERKNNWQMNLITIFKWLVLVCSFFSNLVLPRLDPRKIATDVAVKLSSTFGWEMTFRWTWTHLMVHASEIPFNLKNSNFAEHQTTVQLDFQTSPSSS